MWAPQSSPPSGPLFPVGLVVPACRKRKGEPLDERRKIYGIHMPKMAHDGLLEGGGLSGRAVGTITS